jgi:hypothetical protein
MELVRDCCVADCLKYKNMTIDKSLTRYHPAYKMFEAAWNSLTDAERLLVGDITEIGCNEGFKAK